MLLLSDDDQLAKKSLELMEGLIHKSTGVTRSQLRLETNFRSHPLLQDEVVACGRNVADTFLSKKKLAKNTQIITLA